MLTALIVILSAIVYSAVGSITYGYLCALRENGHINHFWTNKPDLVIVGCAWPISLPIIVLKFLLSPISGLGERFGASVGKRRAESLDRQEHIARLREKVERKRIREQDQIIAELEAELDPQDIYNARNYR